jgi:ABC-type phosphate/phosphonate transport system substrate-binding protein
MGAEMNTTNKRLLASVMISMALTAALSPTESHANSKKAGKSVETDRPARDAHSASWDAREQYAARNEAIDIGLFPGTVSVFEPHILMGRYLPLMNHLSDKSGAVVSFIPENNVGTLKTEIAKKHYDVIYVNAEAGVTALLNGYTPIIKRNSPITSVFMVSAESPIKTPDDVIGKRVAVIGQAMVTTIARSWAIDKNAYQKIEWQNTNATGQNQLAETLTAKIADAAVLRLETANSIISKGGKFRILGELGAVPGFLLMAKAQGDEVHGDINKLAASFLSIKRGTPHGDNIIKGMDGAIEGDADAFSLAAKTDLDNMKKILENVEKATGNSLIVRPAKGAK